nr:uncharacterized protein LOC125423871 [Ziziphus jujuba var. spinosa]
MDMPSYLSKLGHQGHWRDQMERESHYSFPHFAIEFFGNYYHKGRVLLEERMKNVDHFQHRFISDVLPSIEETRPQLKGSSLLEETMENVDHFQHRFISDVLPSIEETRPQLKGSSLLEETMENVDHFGHLFNENVSPSI